MIETESRPVEFRARGYSPAERASLEGWVRFWIEVHKEPEKWASLESWVQLWIYLHNNTDDRYANANFLHEICANSARDWGVLEVFERSQNWPGFQQAWDSWLSAMERWIRRQVAPVLGEASTPQITVRQWHERLFLARIEAGRGDDPEWFKAFAPDIFLAAARGDVGFFARFAQTQRRKPDPRDLQWHLLNGWIAAALWTATHPACANFIFKRSQFRHGTRGSVREAGIDLGLRHSPKPMIKGWQFADKGKKLAQPKPVFYPNRLPKV